ncbi:MAG: ABC transporter substrate-binding protein [Alkalispirochaeta sp.]
MKRQEQLNAQRRRQRRPGSQLAQAISHRVFLIALAVAILTAGTVSTHASGRPEVEGADGAVDTAADTRTIVDGLGREVVVPADPRRIVTAGRGVMMTANVLWAFEDISERVIGVGRISQGRGNFLFKIDPDYGENIVLERNVGPEQIASLAPDLVILKSGVRSGLGQPLERLGLPVLYVDLENPEQYQRDLAVIGGALGDTARATELQNYFRSTASRITNVTANLNDDERPSVLLIYYRSSGGEVSFDVPPAGWMQTQLVDMAGGVPVWRSVHTGSGWTTIGFEQIAAWDPEVIILVEYGGEAPHIRKRLERQPRWQELQAVQNGQFYAMPMDHYSWDQPDVRWLLGLQWMAVTLHPDQFADVNLDTRMREFFAELYRIDDAIYEKLIVPTVAGDFPGGTP